MDSVSESEGQAAGDSFDGVTREVMPDEVVTRVTLIRHGEVKAFGERIVRGQLDVPLSLRGEEQSARVVRWFARQTPLPAALYTSDLERCRVLADALAPELGLEPQVEARLREQSMGRWQGRSWSDVTAEDGAAVSAYWDDYVETAPPDGESVRDVAERARATWRELLDRHRGEHVAIVTHIGVIRVLLCHWLGVPLTEALRFAPAVGSVTTVLESAAGAVVETLGERPWKTIESVPPAPLAPRTGGRPRVALSGSAGTGKTTLGRRLAEELGVPFIEEGMRRRLEGGLSVHGLDRAGWRDLMRELWAEQRAAEDAATDGFVADRSSLDFAAFWLHYDLVDDEPETERFLEEMRVAAERYDRILLFPWGALPLVADGVRAPNRWLQLRYHSTLEGVLARYAKDGLVAPIPETSDLELRLASVRESLV